MNTWIIYKIVNNVNKKIYIGLTKQTLKKRWASHVYASRQGGVNTAIANAMRKYGHKLFSIEEICLCHSLAEAAATEIRFIDELGARRPRGYNVTAGGQGVSGFSRPMSTETKEKIRLSHLGKKHSPEHIANSAAAHRGIRPNFESRQKMSLSQRGSKKKPWSEESKRRASEARKGIKTGPQSLSHVEARRRGMRGHIVTQETRNKISAAHKGRTRRPLSLETRLKLSAALKAYKKRISEPKPAGH